MLLKKTKSNNDEAQLLYMLDECNVYTERGISWVLLAIRRFLCSNGATRQWPIVDLKKRERLSKKDRELPELPKRLDQACEDLKRERHRTAEEGKMN